MTLMSLYVMADLIFDSSRKTETVVLLFDVGM